MKYTALAVALFTFSCCPTLAFAQPANLVGFGFNKCRDVMARINDEPDLTLEIFQWAAGYMSGLNSYGIVANQRFKDFDGLIVDGKAGLVTKPILADCINNPDLTLARVVDRFYAKLPSRKWAQ